MKFRGGQDILLCEIDSDTVMLYEAWLKANGNCPNTTSFYMRILRAVYNRAVEKELTEQRHPFKYVYTGIDKTVKRAVPLKAIKRIKELDLTLKPHLDYARDMFLFSFYTRGMSFIDMAYLKKSNLKNGILTYRRRKTGQQLTIKWEKCMEEIVNKYEGRSATQYLLPIITNPFANERIQYMNALSRVNVALKEVAPFGELTDSVDHVLCPARMGKRRQRARIYRFRSSAKAWGMIRRKPRAFISHRLTRAWWTGRTALF